ncbi:class I SAM-dependent methyltransferase [Mycobacterium paraterrae]|uniref:Class I SAM-dependent methyltransferase n=1 Tax=Mycobacterium paraterrae TaxID=577492 RepID=A0ABY3VY29_9MYCO|nr:class I SAM-dependent methyltransferase [Mycobacterium paraterrae]UMB72126.1 class I SAM-dependent methyltransferase [Mycobacterium paraterrae]
MRCRLCDSERLRSVLDLGATPPCNSFLTPGELDFAEPTFPLNLRLCENCLLLQIPALTWPGVVDDDRPYFSSFSESWAEHAKRYVVDTIKRLRLSSDSFVVEVASNDGYLLRHVAAAGIPCLGIEPSVNVGVIARDRGVQTVAAFLSESLAREIRGEHGPADLLVANNVYSRISDLRSFTRALRALLADDGWLSIEVRHALKLVQESQFDAIDHDNVHYYTLLSATRALATAGLNVVDAELLPTCGGSLRIWARPARAAAPPSDRVVDVLRVEKAAGLHRVEGYLQLRSRTATLRQNLLRFLLDCRAAGERVVGYGSHCSGGTLLNYCGIRSDLVEYIVDRDPYRHGCFTPGTRIPIHDPRRIEADQPDVVLALSGDLEPELADQLGNIGEWGGRLVSPRTLQRPVASLCNGSGVKHP